MISNLEDAHQEAVEMCIEFIATATGIQELNGRAIELKQFVDGTFHALINSERSGQVAGEMAGIMSDLGAINHEALALSVRFEAVASALDEFRLPG